KSGVVAIGSGKLDPDLFIGQPAEEAPMLVVAWINLPFGQAEMIDHHRRPGFENGGDDQRHILHAPLNLNRPAAAGQLLEELLPAWQGKILQRQANQVQSYPDRARGLQPIQLRIADLRVDHHHRTQLVWITPYRLE